MSEEAKDPKASKRALHREEFLGVSPPNPEDLPPEERFQVSSEDNPDSGLYGEFTDEDRSRQQMEKPLQGQKTAKENSQFTSFMVEIKASRQGKTSLTMWLEDYEIEMDDGSVKKYYRVAPTQHQWDELEDLRIRCRRWRGHE